MTRCVSCASEIPDTSRFCLACGKPVADNSETAVMPLPSTPVSGAAQSRAEKVPARVSSGDGRLAAGTLLAGRYQIIGLLGKGGMGEVYRANDLTLDQPVALKFLPEAMSRDAGMLARFHSEVRIARRVSHPNVCRVYDIGEVDGRPYLSMEYIDGEDLGSLLRRIGRLPADKALEFSRRVCAGLAAAHDKGVLHRDLKPSNIMIDGEGHVFITDFGLAAAAGELRDAQSREGTPAYMAPEQLAGGQVTVQSDIYALGLVLYEMFAGKRPFEAATLAEMVRLQQQYEPTSLSSIAKDVDPAVERVVQRCLAPDPRQRPSSALAVAAALPGSDPLAAALAAGETPSPDLVAAAGETVGIRPLYGLLSLAATLAALAVVMLLGAQVHMVGRLAMDDPPDVLARKARDLTRALGYTARPAGTAHGFDYDFDYVQYVQRDPSPARWQSRLNNSQPPPIDFWYRQSPRPLRPEAFGMPSVTSGDPPLTNSGMVTVILDPQGRLLEFDATPPQIDKSPDQAPPDWKRLFDAAGLDIARFTGTAPQWTPLGICDARAAWTGAFPSGPPDQLRVEAAAWRGRPIYFQLIGPWTRPERMQNFQLRSGLKAGGIAALVLSACLILAATWLARRNVRLGRGDRRGAFRLAAFTSFTVMLVWLLNGSHVTDFGELLLFVAALGYALLCGGAVWILYIAIEPFARRRWPHSMISWNRLLAGGLRDPLVGRDLLVGLTLGMMSALVVVLHESVMLRTGATPSIQVSLSALMGVRGSLATFLIVVANGLVLVLVWSVLLFILRALLRREWLAAAVFVVIYMTIGALVSPEALLLAALFTAIETAILVFVMLRFGLLALLAAAFAYEIVVVFPINADFSAWYAGASTFALLSVAAVAAYAFHTALAGRPLFGDKEVG